MICYELETLSGHPYMQCRLHVRQLYHAYSLSAHVPDDRAWRRCVFCQYLVGHRFFIDLRHQCHYGPYLGENGRQEGKTPHGHPGQPAPIDQLFPRRHRDNAVTAYVYAHVSRFCFRSMAHGAGYHDDLRATEKARHLLRCHAGRSDSWRHHRSPLRRYISTIFGMRMSFYLAAVALFLNFLVLLFFIKEPPVAETPKEETKESRQTALWKVPIIRYMLICAALVQVVILIVQPIMTTYITSLAGHVDNLIFVSGLVFSLGGFASAITAPLWGRFGQHHGFFRSLRYALFLAGMFFLLQMIPDSVYTFAASQFAVGLFFSGIYPSINAILAEHTTAQTKGSVFGLLFSAQQIGAITGPILGGFIATFAGMKYVFLAAGLLLLITASTVKRKQRQYS